MAVQAGRVLGGAATGAAAGSVLGPWGTAGGAVVGGVIGALSGGDSPSAPPPNPANFQLGQGNGSDYTNQIAGALANRGNVADQAGAGLQGQAAGAYGVAGAAQGIGAPQIQQDAIDRQRQLAALGGTNLQAGALSGAAGQLQQLGTNGLPMGLAEAQLRQGQDANMNQQLALAHSGRTLGGGAQALQQAQFQNAQTGQVTNQQAAAANIQEQQANQQFKLGALGASQQGYGAAGSLYGQAGNQAGAVNQTDIGVQQANAGLQQQQSGINNQTSATFGNIGQGLNASALGYGQLGQGYQGQGLGVLGTQLNANEALGGANISQGNLNMQNQINQNTANNAMLTSGLQTAAQIVRGAGGSGGGGGGTPTGNAQGASGQSATQAPNFGSGGPVTDSLKLTPPAPPASGSNDWSGAAGYSQGPQQMGKAQNPANNAAYGAASGSVFSDRDVKTGIQPANIAMALRPGGAPSAFSPAALSLAAGAPRGYIMPGAPGSSGNGAPIAHYDSGVPYGASAADYNLRAPMPSGAPSYVGPQLPPSMANSLAALGGGQPGGAGGGAASPVLSATQRGGDPYLAAIAGQGNRYLPSGYWDPTVTDAATAPMHNTVAIGGPDPSTITPDNTAGGYIVDNTGLPTAAPAPGTNASNWFTDQQKKIRASDVHSKTRIQQLEARLAALQPQQPDTGALDAAYRSQGGTPVAPPSVDLRPAQGYSYEYKDPAAHGQGRFYGPMAQDLEQTPAGASTVKRSPDGTKMVDTSRLALVNTSAISEQQRKLEAMQRQLAALSLPDMNAIQRAQTGTYPVPRQPGAMDFQAAMRAGGTY